MVGYANYPMDNNSKNVRWLSWFTWGLALHNNHHKYPARANFAVERGEVDIGYWLIKLLGFKDTSK
jgi:stearoyl-CoA desaturase (delta-9 desaturase)